MPGTDRRGFLAGAAAAGLFPSIARALSLPASRETGSIEDVQHVVILMQENRSFDHYFGTMRGVRGFGDRHPIPVPGGGTVWDQSDGKTTVAPFHLDTTRTNAMQVPGTPHSFSDAQAAWGQGRLNEWPRFKTPYSMGYYRREDIPFQFALAEAFTISDAHHCSIATGTDPNRIMFWSGAQQDPMTRDQGIPGVAGNSEPNNRRCGVSGEMPVPGYSYQGNGFDWPTVPEVLEAAGIDWRIYQDANNNWSGLMHGGLAFDSFRKAKPGSPLYEKGMRTQWIDRFAADVQAGSLPPVSWILPSPVISEHPDASTPIQGAEFIAAILDILTSNPEVWSRTVFFLTFDENDGLFDHLPAPAVPSLNPDGSLAGKSTLDVSGLYFNNENGKFLDPKDRLSGQVRPWGLGARVPLYILSPWSKGGWVHSEVADHTSIPQFLEKRFGVTVPAISAWHRAICSDLTSAFDFAEPDAQAPGLPDASGSFAALEAHLKRPRLQPPGTRQPLFQEPGMRPSRALAYGLEVESLPEVQGVRLRLVNPGHKGAVLHVYDRLNRERIPRRYTLEAGKGLDDLWPFAEDGAYDLWVLGPNGFLRTFKGHRDDLLRLEDRFDRATGQVSLQLRNDSASAVTLRLSDAYADTAEITVTAGETFAQAWPLEVNGFWYDLTLTAGAYERRLAGRLETGRHSVSDPLMGG